MFALPTLLALLAPLLVHDDSMSFSDIDVAENRIEHRIALQTISILEVLDLDKDSDGRIDRAELEAGRESLGAYVFEHYRLVARDEAGATLPLDGSLAKAFTEVPSSENVYQFVTLTLRYTSPGQPRALEVDVSLFEDTSPLHVDNAVLSFNGRSVRRASLTTLTPAELFDVPPPWGLSHWMARGMGVVGVAALVMALFASLLPIRPSNTTYPWLLFLLSLAVAGGFALALAIPAPLPPRIVALVAPLSVAYLAANAVLYRDTDPAWIAVALFGVLHGLSLAATLAVELRATPQPIHAAGATLGGLTLALLALALVTGLVVRWMPLRLRQVLAVGAGAFGLYRFTVEAGWL